MPYPSEGQVEHRGRHDQGRQTYRNVDVEAPPPRQVFGEEPSNRGSRDRREGEGSRHIARVPPPLARRKDFAEDGHGERGQATRPEALQAPEQDQLGHGLRHPGQRRTDKEDDNGCLVDPLAPVEVAELAVDRGRARGGEQVGGHNPRQMVEAAEVPDDGRQSRRHDGLVEPGEQHSQHERRVDDQDPAVRHGARVAVGRQGALGGCSSLGRGERRPLPSGVPSSLNVFHAERQARIFTRANQARGRGRLGGPPAR